MTSQIENSLKYMFERFKNTVCSVILPFCMLTDYLFENQFDY